MTLDPMMPLVRRDDDPFERALLRAGQRERAPKGADRRLLAALGIGGGGVLAALAVKYGGKLGAKGLTTLAISMAAVAAGGFLLSSAAEIQTSGAMHAPVAALPTAAPTTDATPVETLPSTRVEDLPSLPSTAKEDRAARSAATTTATTPIVAASAERTGDLAREIGLLQDARAALKGGDARGALHALDIYEREFARGALLPESRVLRIEALVRAGGAEEEARANALGDAFLREHPSGPQARRVRALLGRDR